MISLKDFIAESRNKLFALWDAGFISQAERTAFKPAYTDTFTDETLESIEQEIESLQEKQRRMGPLLEFVRQRTEIKQQMMEYQLKANDPKRFRVPGALLKEEKWRKHVSKHLPKLTEQLRQLVPPWEQANGPFVIDGRSYLQTMQAEEEDGGMLNKKIVTISDMISGSSKHAGHGEGENSYASSNNSSTASVDADASAKKSSHKPLKKAIAVPAAGKPKAPPKVEAAGGKKVAGGAAAKKSAKTTASKAAVKPSPYDVAPSTLTSSKPKTTV